MAEPSDLWDQVRGLFLDPGSGLNIYLMLSVGTTNGCAPFRVVVACSTTGASRLGYLPCVGVWTGQRDDWDSVICFLNEAEEITGYTCVDYLRRNNMSRHN